MGSDRAKVEGLCTFTGSTRSSLGDLSDDAPFLRSTRYIDIDDYFSTQIVMLFRTIVLGVNNVPTNFFSLNPRSLPTISGLRFPPPRVPLTAVGYEDVDNRSEVWVYVRDQEKRKITKERYAQAGFAVVEFDNRGVLVSCMIRSSPRLIVTDDEMIEQLAKETSLFKCADPDLLDVS